MAAILHKTLPSLMLQGNFLQVVLGGVWVPNHILTKVFGALGFATKKIRLNFSWSGLHLPVCVMDRWPLEIPSQEKR